MRAINTVRLRTVGIATGVLMLTAGGAYAAGQINSADIQDDSIRSVDLRDGRAVGGPDLTEGLSNRIANLEQRISELEDNNNSGISPANWADGQPNDNSESRVVDANTIELNLAAGDTAGTSVETNNLNVPVQAGDVISFGLALSNGAQCTAGAPRMFVETQGTFTNSADDGSQPKPDACGGDDGIVTFTVPNNGRIGQAGFAYDNSIPGTVTITDLQVDGQAVPFE